MDNNPFIAPDVDTIVEETKKSAHQGIILLIGGAVLVVLMLLAVQFKVWKFILPPQEPSTETTTAPTDATPEKPKPTITIEERIKELNEARATTTVSTTSAAEASAKRAAELEVELKKEPAVKPVPPPPAAATENTTLDPETQERVRKMQERMNEIEG